MQQAITCISTNRPDLYGFEIGGRITKDDIEGMARILQAAFDIGGKVDIIIVIKRWDGIDLGAAFDAEAMKAQARANAHVNKYAVVGAPGWAEAMINIFSPLTPVEEKTFELAKETEAWAWIGGNKSIAA